MARKTNTTQKARHMARRKAVRGQKTPRKLYPYMTGKARRLAPAMGKYLDENYAEYERQGNESPKVQQTRRMSRSDSTGQLKRGWKGVIDKGTSARRVSSYIDRNGGGRGAAKRTLLGAHEVRFGQDPKRK